MQTVEIYRFANQTIERNGHLCWDVDALYQQVFIGLQKCAERGMHPVSIGIDTWGVDFMLLDAQAQPLGDMVAYRDPRTHGMDALLEEKMSMETLYHHTGIAKQPFNTLYQLMAVCKEHPQYRTAAKRMLLVPEYLSFLLTGKMANEYTNASTTALLNAITGQWDQEVIRAAELPSQLFGQAPVAAGSTLGCLRPELVEELGFDAHVLLPATHDTGSAFMAIPAKDDHAVFLSSGTWSLLGTELAHPRCDRASLVAGFTNEGGYGGKVRYLKNIMGLWMLQCIHTELNAAYRFEDMATMAAGSTYPAYIDAADNRFLAPASMLAEVQNALAEQDAPEPQGIADILRAVTVGLAKCYQKSIGQLGHLTGKLFTSINIVGGGSQNVVLNQLTADYTGLPVYAGPVEGTAIGNLAAQMIADGVLPDLQQARKMIYHSFGVKAYMPKKQGGQ